MLKCVTCLYILYASHLLSHSVIVTVVNGVVYNDSIGFGGWVPQQGDRGGGHIHKSHIPWGVKWL